MIAFRKRTPFLILLVIACTFTIHQILQDNHNVIVSNSDDVENNEPVKYQTTVRDNLYPNLNRLDWDNVRGIPVTVVTAYWNIGSLSRGAETEAKTPEIYTKYLRAFKHVENPVIIYLDDHDIAEKVALIRFGLPTKIIVKHRADLWSFQIEPRIRKIYSSPNYPYHVPNTSSSLYAAATHAKYDIMPEAAAANPFNTKYFAWLDAGYFRGMSTETRNRNFTLTLPAGFNSSTLAYNVAFKKRNNLAVNTLIAYSYTWVAGGLFFGTKETITTLSADYRATLHAYIDLGYTNTDQQILYALYSPLNNLTKPHVAIQEYFYVEGYDRWMSLGLYIRDMWYSHNKMNFSIHPARVTNA